MSGSIADFLASFQNSGLAKTSHFDVMLPSFNSDFGRILTYRCEAAEIPGRQIATIDNKIYGPTYKTPLQNVYADITLTFLETGDMDIRVYFENWMDRIWDSKENYMNYPNKWLFEVSIIQYDMIGESNESNNLKKTLTCKLIDAFPLNINQMPTSWSENSFHRVQVVLGYRKYELIHHSRPIVSDIRTSAELTP